MIGLCDRWHKTPAEILAMPAHHLRLLDIYRLGHCDEDAEGGDQS